MELKDRIKRRREELGLSQEELAKRLGYKSRSSINKIELGKTDITQSKIKAFAHALETTHGYLMGDEDETNNVPYSAESDPDMLAINMYKCLDPDDKAEIRGEMKQMLKADKYSDNAPLPITYLFSMPFYNIPVSAGTGEFLDSDDYEMLDLTDEPPRGANFIVRVSGDSMEPTYHDGDKLFIKQQPNIEIGEIGIFMIDGSVYVKEFDSDGLVSHNDKYDKIKFTEYENIRCYGKVIGTVE